MRYLSQFLKCCFAILISCTYSKGQTMGIKNKLIQEIPESDYDLAILYYADKAFEGNNIIDVLKNSDRILRVELKKIPEDQIQFKYGIGKWTVGEVLQHLISYERIMVERAMIIAGVLQSDFKYQNYTQISTAKGGRNKTKSELITEFLETRRATIEAFQNLTEVQLGKIGFLDGYRTSVRMISFCISGHQAHHFQILKNKYQIL